MIIDPYTWYRCRIGTISPAATDTVAIGFKRPAGYTFRAGQYAVVRITRADGTSFIRQYSFSSAPERENLELLVQHEPEGVVSSWFCLTARVGDELEISQPFGSFTLEKGLDRPVLLIAGRVGIAPFISMLRDEVQLPAISLLYSVRNETQICFPESLEQFQTTIVQTDVSPRIDELLLKKLTNDKPLVYLCGSKQFVDNLMVLLHGLGVLPEDIKRELFTLQ